MLSPRHPGAVDFRLQVNGKIDFNVNILNSQDLIGELTHIKAIKRSGLGDAGFVTRISLEKSTKHPYRGGTWKCAFSLPFKLL